MKINIIKYFCLGILISASLFFCVSYAQSEQIDRETYGTIHNDSASTNYQVNSQVADPAVGQVTSSNYILDHYLKPLGSAPYDHCRNGIQDFDETGIDCGGATCPACPVISGGGGAIWYSSVFLSGKTSPGAKITILRNGFLMSTIIADPSGNFFAHISNAPIGAYNYVLYAEDTSGTKTASISYYLTVYQGQNTVVENIILPPTINVGFSQVKQGDQINFYGQSVPNSPVIISLLSEFGAQIINLQTTASLSGFYEIYFDTSNLSPGKYHVLVRTKFFNLLSEYSLKQSFVVSHLTIEKVPEGTCPKKGDVNYDCRVNLVDFSITAYWYKRTISQQFLVIEKDQLNSDGKIDLVDFSIQAYYWTG